MSAPQILLNSGYHQQIHPDCTQDPFLDMVPSSEVLDVADVLLRYAPPNRMDGALIRRYALWTTFRGVHLLFPKLDWYRDYLIDVKGLKPGTAANELLTIRRCYEKLQADRTYLFTLATTTDDWFKQQQIVDEIVTRITLLIDPKVTRVRRKRVQDSPDDRHRRLSQSESLALITAPGLDRLITRRDTALIALGLCTGLRVSELVGLNVADLRKYYGGELAIHVRHGKGAKERLVPYGELVWCLQFVDLWLDSAGIETGAVFCQLQRAPGLQGYALRPGQKRLSVRAVRNTLRKYPIPVANQTEPVIISPHDMRRTYSLRCYLAGMDLMRIQRNLGHDSSATTQHYIGPLDGTQRRPPAAYDLPQTLFDQLKEIQETSE